VPRLY